VLWQLQALSKVSESLLLQMNKFLFQMLNMMIIKKFQMVIETLRGVVCAPDFDVENICLALKRIHPQKSEKDMLCNVSLLLSFLQGHISLEMLWETFHFEIIEGSILRKVRLRR
jgi:hypothetical protein